MPYCALADVQGWLSALTTIGAGTSPSDTVVTGWISDFSGKLDAALERGNAVLPLSAGELLDLKLLVARKVAYEVQAAKANAEDTKLPALYLGWNKEWEDALLAIVEGKYAVETVESGDNPDSFTRDADPCDPTDSRNPIFVRDYEP